MAAALLLAFLAYAIVYPLLDMGLREGAWPGGYDEGDFAELSGSFSLRALEAFLAAWMFMLGGAIGSFINVVVWRMPRGESVAWRPSRCPWCDVDIRASDNVPVFGWLLLGGRCRACRLPISPRYPIVEALMGMAFLALASCEIFAGGVNLPFGRPYPTQGIADHVLEFKPDLAVLFILHGALIAAVAAAGLIDHDRQPLPWKIPAFLIALGLAAPALWLLAATDNFPSPLPIVWRPPLESPAWLASAAPAYFSAISGGLLGAAAGALLGIIASATSITADRRAAISWGALAGGIGLLAGPWGVAAVLLLWIALSLLLVLPARLIGRRRLAPPASGTDGESAALSSGNAGALAKRAHRGPAALMLLAVACFLQLILWRWLLSI